MSIVCDPMILERTHRPRVGLVPGLHVIRTRVSSNHIPISGARTSVRGQNHRKGRKRGKRKGSVRDSPQCRSCRLSRRNLCTASSRTASSGGIRPPPWSNGRYCPGTRTAPRSCRRRCQPCPQRRLSNFLVPSCCAVCRSSGSLLPRSRGLRALLISNWCKSDQQAAAGFRAQGSPSLSLVHSVVVVFVVRASCCFRSVRSSVPLVPISAFVMMNDPSYKMLWRAC